MCVVARLRWRLKPSETLHVGGGVGEPQIRDAVAVHIGNAYGLAGVLVAEQGHVEAISYIRESRCVNYLFFNNTYA